MKLVSFCEDYLVADYLRLELVDLEDYLALVDSAPLCARYASAWYVGIGRAVVYKGRIDLRRQHQARRYVHGTHLLAASASVALLCTRYASAVAWLYAWSRRCVQGTLACDFGITQGVSLPLAD